MPSTLRRCQLYVPGNNDRMVRKASGLSVDSIIFDLEDAVPTGEKQKARDMLQRLLEELEFRAPETCVRINSLSTGYSQADLQWLSGIDEIDTVIVPKTEHDTSDIHRSTGKRVIPLIETPKGFVNLEKIALSEGTAALAWAGGDLAFLTGGDISAYERNPYILTAMALVSGAYGLECIDKVYFDIGNIDGLVSEASNSRKYGFAGKQVIHPSHIEPVIRVYSPNEEQLRWARDVMDAYRKSENLGVGAIRMNGELVDSVHVRMAERILRTVGVDTGED